MEALSSDTQAALMLSSKLGMPDVKPLTLAEYNKLGRQLLEKKLRPGDLITGPVDGFLIEADRLRKLLGRGTALAVSVERWLQAGIRVVGRSDGTYPLVLRSKLKANAAPVLFCSGNLDLLSTDAICIVGSRDASTSGLEFAARLGRACAKQRISVVSGDARGVDREAMQAAISEGGIAIGVLAETLATAVLSKRNRDSIMDSRLVMISPFDPDARFTVAHAMERNRYLYALGMAAIIVDSDIKGGTWSGALENQKHSWTPAFVRTGSGTLAGNDKLASHGLIPLPDTRQDFSSLRAFLDSAKHRQTMQNGELLLEQTPLIEANEAALKQDADDLFALFCMRLRILLGDVGKSEIVIADHFGLGLDQAQSWLDRALAKGIVLRRNGSDVFHLPGPFRGN